MNSYAMEQIAQQRTAEVRAEAARSQTATHRGPSVRDLTGWALIQIGLALVTSSARQQHTAVISPEVR